MSGLVDYDRDCADRYHHDGTATCMVCERRWCVRCATADGEVRCLDVDCQAPIPAVRICEHCGDGDGPYRVETDREIVDHDEDGKPVIREWDIIVCDDRDACLQREATMRDEAQQLAYERHWAARVEPEPLDEAPVKRGAA